MPAPGAGPAGQSQIGAMLPPADWNPANPATDLRLSDWECVQYLVRALNDGGGNAEAAKLVAGGPAQAELAV